MSDLLNEAAFAVIEAAACNVVKKYKTAIEWKHIFIESGKSIIDRVENSDQIFDELAKALSEESMSGLAKAIETDDEYELEEKLKKYIEELFERYEIAHDEVNMYSQVLCSIIIRQIRIDFPEKYDRIYFKRFEDHNNENQEKMLNELSRINNQLDTLRKNEIEVYSANDIDKHIKHITDRPRIGISFFCIDDDEFKDTFDAKRSNDRVFVKSRCREEAIYCIINELWSLNEKRPIFVVKSYTDWKHLLDINTTGNIYIPWFFADEIPAIPNNTSIFVLSEDMPDFSNDCIRLRPRTMRTIIKSLEMAGMDQSKAYELVNETHGLFIPMKAKLFNGAYLKQPEWVTKLSDNIKKTCLLVGHWTDNEGDQAVIEQLCGLKYREFMAEINPYIKCEDPLIYELHSMGKCSYALASVENTWQYVDIDLNDAKWNVFIEIFKIIINESETLFTYSGEEQIAAQFRGERLFWSEQIRHAMIRTLILKAYYKNDNKCQEALDQLITEILEYIHTIDQWIYISKFIVDICEISPKAVLNRFQNELSNSTGLLALFDKQKKQDVFYNDERRYFIFALESMITQERFAADSLDILLRLDSNYSQLTKDTLDRVYSAWINFTPFDTADKKIIACEKAFSIDKNAWDIIYDALPKNNNSFYGELRYPTYREHYRISQVSITDLRNTTFEYIKQLSLHLNFKVDRIIKLISVAVDYDEKSQKYILDSTKHSLSVLTDCEKQDIKDAIRDIIFKHRYYTDASWAYTKDKIAVFEELYNNINVKEKEYGYRYLFKNGWDTPLLEPEPYENEKSIERNRDSFSTLKEDAIKHFKSGELSLVRLIQICADNINCTLGTELAKYWSKSFDKCVFKNLLRDQKSGYLAVDYYRYYAYQHEVENNVVVEIAEKLASSDDIIAALYRVELETALSIPQISNAPEKIKKLFWSKPILALKETNYKWAINECKKYGNFETYIELVFLYKDSKECKEELLYDYFVESKNCVISEKLHDYQMTQYRVKEILNDLYDHFSEDDERSKELSLSEINLYGLLEWGDMRFCYDQMRKTPELYAELISIVLKKDHEDGEDEVNLPINKKLLQKLYPLYDAINFCPAENGRKVEEERLEKWLSEFKQLLKNNDQSSLFGHCIGKLFSNSPVGEDGYSPCEAVRVVIEKEATDELQTSYIYNIFNGRGVYTASAGRNELNIAIKYKENADGIALQYPKTAEIYYRLYDIFKNESEEEREEAVNAPIS